MDKAQVAAKVALDKASQEKASRHVMHVTGGKRRFINE